MAVEDAHRHTPDNSGKPLCAAQSLERIAGKGPRIGMLNLFALDNFVLKIPQAPEERYHNRNGICGLYLSSSGATPLGFAFCLPMSLPKMGLHKSESNEKCKPISGLNSKCKLVPGQTLKKFNCKPL
jgi:hypothetical protein